MLGRLGVGRRTVAVAGTHGKSTTAAMLAHLLIRPAATQRSSIAPRRWAHYDGGGADNPVCPTRSPGNDGRPGMSAPPTQAFTRRKHSGGRAGGGEIMLVEACEYRANFLHLRPRQAAILGIEPDHFDCYDSLAQLEDAFRRFAESLPNDGLLVARHDCRAHAA